MVVILVCVAVLLSGHKFFVSNFGGIYMLKIVGLLRKTISFKDDSGRTVSGYQVFCTDDRAIR